MVEIPLYVFAELLDFIQMLIRDGYDVSDPAYVIAFDKTSMTFTIHDKSGELVELPGYSFICTF